MSDAMTARDTAPLDQALAESVAQGRVPGLVAAVAGPDGTIYLRAFGMFDVEARTPMPVDAVFRIASMTKLATTLVALHLVEDGRLDLNAPVADLLPSFARLPVLTGFDGDTPMLRPPRGVARVRELLTHTSGLAYDTWYPDLRRYVEMTKLPNLSSGLMRCFEAPLVADPGTAFHYGTGMDWLGLVIEAVTGEGLDAVFARALFGPLGLRDTWLWINTDPGLVARAAPVHIRQPDGSWRPSAADYWAPGVVAPEYLPGGHCLYATAADFLRLQRVVLGGGELDGVRIVEPATIERLFHNEIGELDVGIIPTSDPAASAPIDLRGWRWSLGLLLAEHPAADMRSPGSAGWEGGFNTFYWVDRRRAVTAALYTATLPFHDPGVIAAYQGFERAVSRLFDGAGR